MLLCSSEKVAGKATLLEIPVQSTGISKDVRFPKSLTGIFVLVQKVLKTENECCHHMQDWFVVIYDIFDFGFKYTLTLTYTLIASNALCYRDTIF